MNKAIPFILLILTMLLWAANFYAVKIALEHYAPLGIATWRFLFGVLTLLGILFIRNRKEVFLLKYKKKEWWYLFLTAFFGIFLTIYFFNVGLKTTSAINGSLILATAPAITGVFSFFLLKQRLTFMQWLAISISFFGVIIILVKGDVTKLFDLKFEIGDIYILLMAIVFSYSQIIVSKHLAHIDAIKMTSIASFFALVLFSIFSIPELAVNTIPTAPSFWWSVLFMGVLGTGLAYAAFFYCVVKLGTTISALSMNLIPFFAVLLAFPFGEKLHSVQIFGGVIIILGIVIFKRNKR
ncbi:EamA family transporter [Pontimicrobium sp. SW4]|uniref:EamA family transporter n=1 Tax=Pontimicrobium sp. SW4 TaxID=3153519 RepID=A0AAU7BUA4_9FLAO